jgi:hypothetical protein
MTQRINANTAAQQARIKQQVELRAAELVRSHQP